MLATVPWLQPVAWEQNETAATRSVYPAPQPTGSLAGTGNCWRAWTICQTESPA